MIWAPLLSVVLQAQRVEKNVTYGPHLVLDVYRPKEPAASPRPGVILVHGGSWMGLDKSTLKDVGVFLARQGFVAFSVDYRLWDGKQKNRWPAQLDDVRRAVRWVRANAATYGVDPQRIGAFGHSAGAQIAALLGMEDPRDSSRVQAVVDVSGPTDFTSAWYRNNIGFFTGLFGADTSRHDVWRAASPALSVSAGDAPYLVIHGTKDETVEIAQAQEFVDSLQAKGVPVSFVTVDAGHDVFDAPDAAREIETQTVAFFQRYLR